MCVCVCVCACVCVCVHVSVRVCVCKKRQRRKIVDLTTLIITKIYVVKEESLVSCISSSVIRKFPSFSFVFLSKSIVSINVLVNVVSKTYVLKVR